MQKDNLFTPLLKTIDKIVFGFQEINEQENKPEWLPTETDEEFDVERSSN